MVGLHHVISGIILRNKDIIFKKEIISDKKFFLSIYILGCISPDFDFIFNIFNLGFIGHKTLTHSLLFLFIIILISLIFFKKTNYFYIKIFSVGYLLHLILDVLVGGKVFIYRFGANNNLPIQFINFSYWYNGYSYYLISLMFLIILIFLIIKKDFSIIKKDFYYSCLLIVMSIFGDMLYILNLLNIKN